MSTSMRVIAASAAALVGWAGTAVADRSAQFPFEFRTITGWGNNIANPQWGAARTSFIRRSPADYSDGWRAPAGSERRSAREISNLVVAQTELLPNVRGASDFIWQWGQFIDHDLDETPTRFPTERFDIPVPTGDPWFDPHGTGTQIIPLSRSHYAGFGAPRQQMNFITSFIDASQVYGSDEARADELRTLDGTGRLKTSEGDFLPFNVNGFPNAPDPNDPRFYLAGDVRVNEQVALIAIHTLFVREHNYWADAFRSQHPGADDETIYQFARAIVAAEIQAITYNEFLPVLLGPDAIEPYTGYRGDVNASVDNVFATAAFRLGHSLLSEQIQRLRADGRPIKDGHLPLAEAFFNPEEFADHGLDPVMRGLATQAAQEIDTMIVDAVRNFLFGPPGSGGFDLAALNIQRGRDHGLCGYNQLREDFGLARCVSFSQVDTSPQVLARLASAYDSVDEIDAWVGCLAENHVPGAMVGETLRAILVDQFTRTRDGDRFWYQGYLPFHLVIMVESQTLSQVIMRNTGVGSEMQDNAFIVD